MKIVVTDGATLNPGDLSWQELEKLGDCDIYPRSTYQENLERSRDADIAVTNKVVFDKKTIDACPNLKMISITATGYDIIDIDAARTRDITVTNVPVYGTTSVAQMTFALLLELCHHVGYHAETVRQSRWVKSDNFCYWDKPLIELDGLTFGLIGCGRIGQSVARLARAFGMDVLGYDTIAQNVPEQLIEMTDNLDRLLAESDVISLHVPLTPDTEGLINSANIAKMKKSAFLINTSRGPVINEKDLAEALDGERIAGAGLDVLSTEPPEPDNPMLKAKNCYVTPHTAWATRSARRRLMDAAVANVKNFIEGNPTNVIN